jgi:uncharacterized membrane protein YbhN (UPF0104 family)
MSRKPSSLRSILVNVVLAGVGLGLLALAVHQNRGPIRDVLSRPIDGRLIAVSFAGYVVALVLTFVRWFVLVRALGLPFRLRDALRLGFVGNVFNLVIPGAVGGDVVKAAFLCREQARRTQAVASMVIDRALGLLGLFLLAGICGGVAWASAGPEVRRLIVVVWAAAAAGLVGLAVVFTPAFYRPLERLFAGHERLETFFAELVAMASSYRSRLATVAVMLGMATTVHALFVLVFYGVSRAIFPEGLPDLGQHLVIVPLVLFTTAVPLPFGALGLTEQVSDGLFRLVGHPGGAVAMMAYRVVMYAGGLVSLVVYLANLRQVRELESVEAEDEFVGSHR